MKTNLFKCHECKQYFMPGTGLDGLPNGMGFVVKDEHGRIKTINVCKACLIKIGREKDANKD